MLQPIRPERCDARALCYLSGMTLNDEKRAELKTTAEFVKAHVQRTRMASLDEVDLLARGVLALLEENERLREAFAGEAPDTAEAVIAALGDCLDSPGGITMAKHARHMETRAREAKKGSERLTADNAALLAELSHPNMHPRTHADAARVQAVIDAPHPGAALLAELQRLREEVGTARGAALEEAAALAEREAQRHRAARDSISTSTPIGREGIWRAEERMDTASTLADDIRALKGSR